MDNNKQESTQPVYKEKIDWVTFSATFALLIAAVIPLAMNPERGGEILNSLNTAVTGTFGVFFLWLGLGIFIFLIYIALSRFGRIKLGKKDENPQFNTISWAAMLFCAGIGSSILYWGTIEWVYYYQAPPFGLEVGSSEAIEWAATYGIFHWGPIAWAMYVLPALPIAYFYYVRQKPVLKVSEACRPILGKLTDGPLGKSLDIFFMFGLLGSAATTLGLGVPMISAGINNLTGIPDGYPLQIGILLTVTIIFGFSAFSGLQKGIKVLSDWNLWIAAILLLFVLFVGPTLFLLKMGTNSIGLLLDNFFRMSMWTDPIENSGFPEAWTIFYWAWWLVFAPFIGLFIAKISKGRTVRQIILGSVGYGTLGCALFFIVFGNYGLYLQVEGILDVVGIVNDQGDATAIIAIIDSLPLGAIAVALFVVLATIFLATTFDSASYILAAITQDKVDDDPIRWNRLFWAFSISILPMILMFIGGLKPLQAMTTLGAVPIFPIIILMAFSFIKAIKRDELVPENWEQYTTEDSMSYKKREEKRKKLEEKERKKEEEKERRKEGKRVKKDEKKK
ncbi:BCCT family transporter [Bacillus fonticola]|uniref:BCCT family transporter n=1 Tax=Bacillus fonticola TaxID=2728853 RepID=UPI001472DB56|nr:BCCT family transporter [Bacillus fonticola]